MIDVLSTNIISPLGTDTELNYNAVRLHQSALYKYNSWKGIKEPFTASLFSREQNINILVDGYTRFESLCIKSISNAITHLQEPLDVEHTMLVLCSTKLNIEELGPDKDNDGDYHTPGVTAKRISSYFGLGLKPIVVCNACISGITGQILALRLIQSGECSYAIVCGADVVTPFSVSGFQSFKVVSPDDCQPFDIDRKGLNLGEAAATIIFGKHNNHSKIWSLCKGVLNNDGYHISTPSPKGDGAYRVLNNILDGVNVNGLAEVCVHGTSTMFNDQMESKAIERAGLSTIPISALKGYFGHTMGAAGILETIITIRSLDDGVILGTRGFNEIGVSGKISIDKDETNTDKTSFVKMLSGFGGCNGSVLYKKNATSLFSQSYPKDIVVCGSVSITPSSCIVNNKPIIAKHTGKDLLTDIFKTHFDNYPKFFKMDPLSRLAYIAASCLMDNYNFETDPEKRGVILFNRTSSVISDRNHIKTICCGEEYYPSPSIFLYTLPNIANGEIAIKFKCLGETSLYILEEKDTQLMESIIKASMFNMNSLITGWLDYESDDNFEAELKLVKIR